LRDRACDNNSALVASGTLQSRSDAVDVIRANQAASDKQTEADKARSSSPEEDWDSSELSSDTSDSDVSSSISSTDVSEEDESDHDGAPSHEQSNSCDDARTTGTQVLAQGASQDRGHHATSHKTAAPTSSSTSPERSHQYGSPQRPRIIPPLALPSVGQHTQQQQRQQQQQQQQQHHHHQQQQSLHGDQGRWSVVPPPKGGSCLSSMSTLLAEGSPDQCEGSGTGTPATYRSIGDSPVCNSARPVADDQISKTHHTYHHHDSQSSASKSAQQLVPNVGNLQKQPVHTPSQTPQHAQTDGLWGDGSVSTPGRTRSAESGVSGGTNMSAESGRDSIVSRQTTVTNASTSTLLSTLDLCIGCFVFVCILRKFAFVFCACVKFRSRMLGTLAGGTV
jgi:hypothetical protein